MLNQTLLLFIISSLLLSTVRQCNSTELLMLVISSSFSDYNNSVAVSTALQSATAEINNNPDILGGDRLIYIEEDSMVRIIIVIIVLYRGTDSISLSQCSLQKTPTASIDIYFQCKLNMKQFF